MMEILEAIRQRRAVRDYRPEPVPPGQILQLIAAAGWAPSAMNEQPWHFTVVNDRAVLEEMSGGAKKFMLASLGDFPNPSHFRDLFADPDYNIFYNAPTLVVISAPAARQWCTEDCALAAQNMMLAAQAAGLGSCWVGFAQAWLNTREGLQSLGLPPQSKVVAPILLGYPKAQPIVVARKSPAVNWIGDGGAILAGSVRH